MAHLQITCINKSNRQDPHDRITNVGGNWGKHTQQEAINYIKSRVHTYYVSVGANSVNVIVAQNQGRDYLKTENDGLHPNNLLSLREC